MIRPIAYGLCQLCDTDRLASKLMIFTKITSACAYQNCYDSGMRALDFQQCKHYTGSLDVIYGSNVMIECSVHQVTLIGGLTRSKY